MNSQSIRFGDEIITYEVIRSQRRKKTIQTKVSLERVRVLAPAGTSDQRLADLIRKQAGWILNQRQILKARPAPKRFVTGDTMPYLGEDYPLAVNTGRFLWPWIRFENQEFLFDAPPDIDEESRRDLIGNAFMEWYRRKARIYLAERVDHWLPFVPTRKKTRILIRNQRRRWGSCASDGTLRFNWRIMMVEPELVDYLVVHELTHLVAMNHSPDFWEHACHLLPDARERSKRLKRAEPILPL